MSVDLSSQHFRGVICRHCSKPVRVPQIVLRKDIQMHADQPAGQDHFQLISRVFVVRCRSCERESIYAMEQIVDCTFPPQAAAAHMAHTAL
jgi:hypothetical protein